MSTAIADKSASGKADPAANLAALDHLPLWSWWAAAFALIVIKAWVAGATSDTTGFDFFGDADDAARLTQVREFMAGAPWFDTTTYKMGGSDGMLSHWSRLIDLPLAAIIAAFSLVLPTEAAKAVTRAIWPLMVFAPLLWLLFKTTTATSGIAAGRIALLLAVLCPLGFYQFDIGRIDHHNVMIAATISAAMMLWAYPQDRRAWLAAGALSGFAVAIGYEALAPIAALATFAALWGLIDDRRALETRTFVAALMAAIIAGFLLTIPPSRWFDIHCDAISLNFVTLSTIAGAGLIIALSLGKRASVLTRFAITGAATAVGIAVYGRLEPACLAGPLGQLPPELWSVWLNHVAENRSIAMDLVHGRIEQALGLIAFFALAIAAQWQRARTTRRAADVFMLAVVVTLVTLACWQYKYMSYASYIALAPLAWWISRLKGSAEVSAPVLQIGAAVFISQATLLGASSKIQQAFNAPQILSDKVVTAAAACEKPHAVKELSSLPPGLIAAHIDLGAYIATFTHHRVLSAPYHRIPQAIIANDRLFASRKPDEAANILKREKIDYIVTCKGLDGPFAENPEWQNTLRADLVNGKAPAFLERVPLPDPQSLFTVWHVRPERLSLQP